VLKKIHLKRNSTDRLTLCRIWPERDFVLIVALSHQSSGTVCKTCIGIATCLAHNDRSEHKATKSAAAELTKLLEQCREDYHRLKAADNEVTHAELSEGRGRYLQALARLSRFLEQDRHNVLHPHLTRVATAGAVGE
jgi:hypothetical protein